MISRQPSPAAARFRKLINQADHEIDLAEAALLIAKHHDADVDVERYVARIEALGSELSGRVPEEMSETERILTLNRFLFDEQGFAPNLDNYYDPRNNFLNEVLERRIGIPISLSIIYIEVGRRIGLALRGVAFPGHFLVKCKLKEGTVVLDPYCGGMSLSLNDLQERLREVRGGEVSRAIVASMLVSANKKEILARMLRNLKSIYLEKEDNERALAVMEWIITLSPADAVEVRERGLLYRRVEAFRAALEDLELYLQLAPDADDAIEVRGYVMELRRAVTRLN